MTEKVVTAAEAGNIAVRSGAGEVKERFGDCRKDGNEERREQAPALRSWGEVSGTVPKAPSGRELSAEPTEGECVAGVCPQTENTAGSFRLAGSAPPSRREATLRGKNSGDCSNDGIEGGRPMSAPTELLLRAKYQEVGCPHPSAPPPPSPEGGRQPCGGEIKPCRGDHWSPAPRRATMGRLKESINDGDEVTSFDLVSVDGTSSSVSLRLPPSPEGGRLGAAGGGEGSGMDLPDAVSGSGTSSADAVSSDGYCEEYAVRMLAYFRDPETAFPTFELFADSIDFTEADLRRWCGAHVGFKAAFDRCVNIQKGRILVGGMTGKYGVQMVKFVAMNTYGMHDTPEEGEQLEWFGKAWEEEAE